MPWTTDQVLAFLQGYAGWSFIFCAAAYVPYFQGVVWEGKRPTLSAWVTWLILDLVIAAGMLAKGVEVGHMLQMVAYIIGCTAILGACLYVGIREWKWQETWCLLFVIVSLGPWYWFREANIGIIVSLVAITVGTWPLIPNILEDPSREKLLPWLLNLIGGILSILAAQEWSIKDAGAPVVFTSLSVVVNVILWRGALRGNANYQKALDVILMR